MATTISGTAITTTTVNAAVIVDSGPASVGPQGITFGDSTVQTSAAAPNYVSTIYTSPATWTKPSTIKAVRVTIVAGGGGGTGGVFPGTSSSGGGGGAAGYGYFPAPSIPGPTAVTVGAAGSGVTQGSTGGTGGTSSFGA